MCFLYDDQFLYHCDIPEDMYAISTPKIWMQPIVENFFKHNFQNDSQLKVVVISGSRQSDGILFQFFDNIGHIREEQIALLNQQFTPEKSKESADTAPGTACRMCMTGCTSTMATGWKCASKTTPLPVSASKSC